MEETWATDLLGAIKYPNVTGVSQYFVSVNLFFGKPIEMLKKKLKNCLWLRSIVLVEEQTDNPSPKGRTKPQVLDRFLCLQEQNNAGDSCEFGGFLESSEMTSVSAS